jgi:hypothetical protein
VEDNFKSRLLLILGILNVIFLLLWVTSCNDVGKFKKARDKEMDSRLESEQKLEETMKLKSGFEEKINKVQKELDEGKAVLEANRKSLIQEQLVSNSLKDELEKISKLKEALEEKLKEALVKVKSTALEKPKK